VEVCEPEKVVEHSRKYREKEDILYSFVQEVVEETPTGILRRTDLWDQWKTWSREENTTMKKSEFNENIMDYMGTQGYKWYEDTCENGTRVKSCWRGCRLKSETFPDDYEMTPQKIP
jgi:phage/plasmid-associated DNA primase